jgi:GTP-binding protein
MPRGVGNGDGRERARERPAEHALIRPTDQSGYEVTRRGEHSFEVSGPAVEKLVARHDLTNQEALAYIEERLRAMGVIKELEAQGFEPGEEITIGEVAFDLYPGREWE